MYGCGGYLPIKIIFVVVFLFFDMLTVETLTAVKYQSLVPRERGLIHGVIHVE